MPEDLSKTLSLPSVQNVNSGKVGVMEDITVGKCSDNPWPIKLAHTSVMQESEALQHCDLQ